MRQAIRFIAALAVAAFVSGCSSNGGGGSIPGSNGAGKSILSYGAGESIPTTSTVCPPGVAAGGASLGLPATSKPPYTTRWGFEVHSLDTTPLPAIAATGATFVRMDLAPNFALNPDGSPNWAAYDSFVQNAQACGLGILFVGPYLYAPSSIPSGTPPCTPGSLCPYITSASQYDAFLEAVATRYSGHGIMYELGPNEPDLQHYGITLTPAQYAQYAIPAAAGIKQYDSTAVTIFAGTYYFDFLWDAVLAAKLAAQPLTTQQNVDAIGTHAYLTLPVLLHPDLDILSQLYGNKKPIYITEFGSPYPFATLLLKMLAAGKSYVPLFNIYEYQDQSPSDVYGMLTFSGGPVHYGSQTLLSQVEKIINP
jgi:hypothetical protein